MKKLFSYFSLLEKLLWASSVAVIVASFFIAPNSDLLSFIASLIGVTSLILCAKGHPVGQMLTVVFSVLYGIISYRFHYYGEMVTYLGMTLPMATLAVISWLRHPFEKGKAEIKIETHLSRRVILWMVILSAAVTSGLYFILKAFGTTNLFFSTLSVTTSFLAVYLCFFRSFYYPLAYAANDVVLIVLWVLASIEDIRYLSVVICFVAFLINDFYAFYNWCRMAKKQANTH